MRQDFNCKLVLPRGNFTLNAALYHRFLLSLRHLLPWHYQSKTKIAVYNAPSPIYHRFCYSSVNRVTTAPWHCTYIIVDYNFIHVIIVLKVYAKLSVQKIFRFDLSSLDSDGHRTLPLLTAMLRFNTSALFTIRQ